MPDVTAVELIIAGVSFAVISLGLSVLWLLAVIKVVKWLRKVL